MFPIDIEDSSALTTRDWIEVLILNNHLSYNSSSSNCEPFNGFMKHLKFIGGFVMDDPVMLRK